jgi:hypothetical protein
MSKRLGEYLEDWKVLTSCVVLRAEREKIHNCDRTMCSIIRDMKAEAVERIKAEKESDELVKSVISTKGFQK